MGSGVCTSGVCKCTVASTDCGVLANTCTSGVCKCGSSAECDATRSDKCDSGTCKCGTNAECATGLTCTGGKCLCSANSQCDAKTTLTDTCDSTSKSCVCSTHGTCSTTASNLCTTAGCKCGTTLSNVAACSGATPNCLTAALATPAVGVAASCKVRSVFLVYCLRVHILSLLICSFVTQLLLFFVSSVKPMLHVMRRSTPKYCRIGVCRVCANVAPMHHALGRRHVRMRLVQRLLLQVLPLLSVRNKCNPLSKK